MNNTELFSKYRLSSLTPISREEIAQLQELVKQFFDNLSIKYYFYLLGRRLGDLLSNTVTRRCKPSEFLSAIIPSIKIRVEEYSVEKSYVYNFSFINLQDDDSYRFPLCCFITGLLESYILSIRKNVLHAYQCVIIQNDFNCSYKITEKKIKNEECVDR
ncbi:MAG: hypothetical protein QXX16_03690 [Nitrososphaerota archaeon]